MLRIVSLAILPGVLLVACASWVSADTAKQKYSNRPIGYTVPTPYYGTPMAPRFVVPPVAQVRVQPPQRAETDDYPRVSSSAAVTPPAPLVGDKTVFILREPAPEVNVNDELDAFYARMAKIQVEKRQLPEALALIQNIRSETFKVRTIVSLAEYVSRDKNYQSEAEQLYRLALTSIDALDKKQPFRIDTGSVRIVIPPVDQTLVKPAVDPVAAPIPEPIDIDEPVLVPQPSETQQGTPSRPVIELGTLGDDVGQNGENGRRPPPPPPPPDEGIGSGVADGIVVSPPGNKNITTNDIFEDDGPPPPDSTTTTKPTQDSPPASSNGTKPIISPDNNFVRPPAVIPLNTPEEATTAPPVTDAKPNETAAEPPKPAAGSTSRPRLPIILTDEN